MEDNNGPSTKSKLWAVILFTAFTTISSVIIEYFSLLSGMQTPSAPPGGDVSASEIALLHSMSALYHALPYGMVGCGIGMVIGIGGLIVFELLRRVKHSMKDS